MFTNIWTISRDDNKAASNFCKTLLIYKNLVRNN